MADTDWNSDQAANWSAAPAEPVAANELSGEVRIARFSFDNTGGTSASDGDTIELTLLPDGARVIDGKMEVTSAFDTDANLEIGVDGDATKWGTVDIDATGVKDFASAVIDDGLATDELSTKAGSAAVIGTFDTAGGNGAFSGYLLYVEI